MFWQRYKSGIPRYDLLGESSSRFDYVVYYSKGDPPANTSDYLPPSSWDNDSFDHSDDHNDDNSLSKPSFTSKPLIQKKRLKPKCCYQ